jgi:glucose-1-phosphate cytidylyltransferase
MKGFAAQGITEFVICVGYKGEQIKRYFLDYSALNRDFTVSLGHHDDPDGLVFHGDFAEDAWTVTVVDTGLKTMTAGRLNRIEPFVHGERFMATYGDGLADVDISSIVSFHEERGLNATMTTVRPPTRFGIVEIADNGHVSRFREKPQSQDWVNAGFFVFEPEVFEYLKDSDNIMLEHEPLLGLARDDQLAAYRHHGFWHPMDTYRESELLNQMWAADEAPWKTWN